MGSIILVAYALITSCPNMLSMWGPFLMRHLETKYIIFLDIHTYLKTLQAKFHEISGAL